MNRPRQVSEPRPSGSGSEELVATVVELLPNAVWRVELESREQVLAHAASARVRNFVRVRPGDRVCVELSPHDPGRGRITRLLKGGL
ncbi:MAG: translation initiation factor IF-1 [Bryobacteraceae bacterium]